MEFKEFTAKTSDEAITKACLEFETSSDNLEYEIVREGKTGIFGIGSKLAIVKARKKDIPEFDPLTELKKFTKTEKKESAKKESVKKEFTKKESFKTEAVKKESVKPEKKDFAKKESAVKEPVKKEYKKSFKKETKYTPAAEPVKTEQPVVEVKKEEKRVVVRTEEQIASMVKEAEKFLYGVFKAMELPVEIHIAYDKDSDCLDIDFEGEDMGILIGKRGQTLDSLQYLTSLVVNKEQQDYIRVKLDTENYRSRRKDTLENLAKNIAFKVRKTRKPVVLEPMNPYERRIIHSALQGNKYVETYSEGNEPYRHVVVVYKNR